VGLRLERIPKENQEIDVAVDDLGADLLIAAERIARGVIAAPTPPAIAICFCDFFSSD